MRSKLINWLGILLILAVTLYGCSSGDADPPSGSLSANAGINQIVVPSDTVMLDAGASSHSGEGVTVTGFSWIQLSGTVVTLANADTATPTFTAPIVAATIDLVFELTALSSNGDQAKSTVTITIFINIDPIANAGNDRNGLSGLTVRLNGGASADPNPGDSIISYSWAQISGPSVTLQNADSIRSNFIAPSVTVDTALVFELTVTDSHGAQNTDFVTVTVSFYVTVTWITNATWAVVQDGPTGEWKKLSKLNDRYIFGIKNPNGLFAIAEYNTDFGVNLVEITYLALSDLTNDTFDSQDNRKLVNGMITGTTPGQSGFVTAASAGDSNYFWSNPDQIDISMLDVNPTVSDLLGNIFTTDANGNTITSRYYVKRNVDFSIVSAQTIDFTSTLSFDAAPPLTITIDGMDNLVTELGFEVELTTKNDSSLTIAQYNFISGTPLNGNPVLLQWRAMPAGKHRIDDYYSLDVEAIYNTGSTITSKRVIHAMTTPINRTITLSNNIDPNILTWNFITNGTNVTSKIEWTNHVDSTYGAPKFYIMDLVQDPGNQPAVEWIINVFNSAWFDSANVIYETPDFSAIAGWDTQFSISQGSEVFLGYESWHTNLTYADVIGDNTPSDGDSVNIVGVQLLATP